MAAPSIANPGFEVPVVGAGQYQAAPTGSGWTFSSTGSGICDKDGPFCSGNPTKTPDGTQVAVLQGTASFARDLPFPNGGTYQVGCLAQQRAGQSNDFQVLVDGQVVGTFRPTLSVNNRDQFEACTTATFPATAGTHRLTFQGLDSNGGDNAVFIDAIAITEIGAAAPTATTPTASTPAATPSSSSGARVRPARAGFVNPNAVTDGDEAEDSTYANLARHGRSIAAQGSPYSSTTNIAAGVDAHGAPLGDFSILMPTGYGRRNVWGTCGVKFSGRGLPSFPDSPEFTILTPPTYNAQANETSFTVNIPRDAGDPSVDNRGIRLQILQTRRTAGQALPAAVQDQFGNTTYPGSDGVAWLWFMRPTGPGATTFHPYDDSPLAAPTAQGQANLFSQPHLAMMNAAPIQGHRVLNDCGTNVFDGSFGVASIGPDHRTLPTRLIQTGEGVKDKQSIAIEHDVIRANQGGQDLWFPVPHTWNDAYITFAANAFRWGTDGVNAHTGPPGSTGANPQPTGGPLYPALIGKVIWEWSNEWTFNNKFGQFQAIANAAVNYVNAAAPGLTDINWDRLAGNSDNQYQLAKRYGARRIGQMQALVDAVFPSGLRSTYDVVISYQKNNYYTLSPMLDYFANLEKTSGRPFSSYASFIGFDWYAQLGVETVDGTYSVDQLIGTGFGYLPDIASLRTLATSLGVGVALYEGGGNETGQGRTATCLAMFNDPRFGRLCRQLLDSMFAQGADVISLFGTTMASWGTVGPFLDLSYTKWTNWIAGLTSWAASPTNGASTDPLPPLSTLSSIVLDPPASVIPGTPVSIPTHFVGTNSPITTAAYSCPDAPVSGAGVLTPPPSRSVPMTLKITAKSTFYAGVSGSVAVLLPAAVGAAPPPLYDAGFEQVDVSGASTGFVANPTGSPWSYAGGSGVCRNGVGYAGPNNVAAPDGTNFLFLQGTAGVSQVVSGFLAGSYTFGFQAAQRDFSQNGVGSNQTVTLVVDGVQAGIFKPPGVAWSGYTTPTITLGAGSHTIALVTNSTSGLDTALVDSVSINLIASTPTTPTAAAGVLPFFLLQFCRPAG